MTDPSTFDAMRTGTAMIVAAKKIYGSAFAWRSDNWIDKLTGSTRFRTMVDAGASTDEVVAAWQAELAAFDDKRREHLLYGPYGGTHGMRRGRRRAGPRAASWRRLVASTMTLTSAAGSTAGERSTSRVLRDGTPQQAGLVTAPDRRDGDRPRGRT